jgi:receptor protein-tyrosine kinase
MIAEPGVRATDGEGARFALDPSLPHVWAFDPKVPPGRPDPRLLIAHSPQGERSEQIRALRTELLLRRGASSEAILLAVLSPCAGEGRSQIAAELAIAFAQTGYPTLLIDADLQAPQQHALFGLPNGQGLAQAIENEAEARLHAVHGLPCLSVLTAGSVAGDPLELLASRRFVRMVDDCRDKFEFVVLDTSPVGRCADALAVASLAGLVLVASRAQHTPQREMRAMLRRLKATQSAIVGAVISHF